MLGTVYGKTSTTKFKFIVEGNVNKWDYVAVNHSELGPILNQVSEIEKEGGKTIAQCQIIGYRTERNFLRQPRTPMEPGSEVHRAEDDLIKSILDLRMNGIYLGKLQGKDIQAYLDPKKLVTKHLAVLAKSGAGKSYAVGVILEELLEMGLPIVILDPHGEYSSIKYENKNSEETKYFKTFGISGKGFSNRVMEFAVNTSVNIDAHPIRLPIPNDSFGLMESLPFKPTDAQRGLLYNVVNDLVERKGVFEFDELIKELEIAESTAKWRLIGGIQQLEQSKLFSHGSTNISDIVKPGQLSIINFKGASSEMQEIVARGILSKIFEERKRENIPPTFIVVDEAHNYCPERGFGETKSSRIIRTIAAEGRKFGVGLCVISQRPARVDKSVLSQCSSQIALQVSNPSDLSAISKSFEGITSEAESEIKNLPIGKAMIIGATDFPIFVDIRVRKSQHGGAAKSFSLGEAKKAIVKSEYKTTNNTIKPVEKDKVNTSFTNTNELFIFEPKISRNELNTLEKNVDSVSYDLQPVLSAIVSKNNRNFHLVFDRNKLGLYKFDGKLTKTMLTSNKKLSPIQTKIYNLIHKNTPLSEVFVKSGLSFSEFNDTINGLSNQKIISIDNKMLNKLDSGFNLDRFNFPVRPKYNKLSGNLKDSKISVNEIKNYLNDNGYKLMAHREAYIPFFKIKSSNGIKIIDSMSYNLEL